MRTANGQIYLGDVPVSEIARTYGTPTYVYDEQKIRENYRRWQKMSPEQKRHLRERFEGFRNLDPERRKELMERHRKSGPKGRKGKDRPRKKRRPPS